MLCEQQKKRKQVAEGGGGKRQAGVHEDLNEGSTEHAGKAAF